METQRRGSLGLAARQFFRTLVQITRQLFHEVTGTFFALFAFLGLFSAWREWKRGDAIWAIGMSAAFGLLMGGYALSSYRRAQK